MKDNDIRSLQSFLADVDKIIKGDLTGPFESALSDPEHKELLQVAQLLARVEFTPENKDFGDPKAGMQPRVNKGQLEDDELDLVAGGINLNNITKEDKDI